MSVPAEHSAVVPELIYNPKRVEDGPLLDQLMAVEKYFSLYGPGCDPRNPTGDEVEFARFSDYNLLCHYRYQLKKILKIKLDPYSHCCWLIYTKDKSLSGRYDPLYVPYRTTS